MSIDLDALLSDAVSRGASDLHLVPGAPPTIRLHGDLGASGKDLGAIGPDDAAEILRPFLSPLDSERFRAGQAVDFSFERAGIGRFRCNLHRSRGGVSASLRILPEIIPDFSTLGL